MQRYLRLACFITLLAVTSFARASEHHGQVTFNGLPVPGATVTATQADKMLSTVSDTQGNYSFTELADGPWKIEVSMSFFVTSTQSVTVAPSMPAITWELKMLPLDQVLAKTKVLQAAAPAVIAPLGSPKPGSAANAKPAEAEAPKPPEDAAQQQSSDGFLVNGSVNNAATSQYSLSQAFGNTRKGSKSLYTGGLGLVFGNSALNARPYSLNGLDTPKTAYSTVTAIATFGGPLRIPHLMPHGPNFFAVYQWTRDNTASIASGLVPTATQRVTANPIAAALLALYPLPNIATNANYNYQTPVLNGEHQDALQFRLEKTFGRRDTVSGTFALQSTRADSSNLFGFRDATSTLGLNTNVNWTHRFSQRFFLNTGYRLSRLRTLTTPYFATHSFAGAGLIHGSSTDPRDAGPPQLTFSSGIASLSDGTSIFNRNRTGALNASVQWFHGRHNVTAGGDFRRQEYNFLSQSNPRGSFSFNGTATGSDIGDFLAGTADTASVAFGNPDKYFRQSVYDAYITDDWRIRPELTLNIGVRWEYGAPLTELKKRLVNLDVAPGFTAVAPILASAPRGPLTGRSYPTSLVQPDKTQFEPRFGLSWRPIPGSSLVVRAGYGIYADTSIYLRNATRMAVQPPLARNLSVSNSAACPLTLADGLAQSQCDAETFGVDPNFRVGYAQTWQIAVQRDLPFALQATATYLGVKGANGVQQYLPNSYALGAVNPCPSCPSGFYYRSTGGTSSRNAGSLQLRRRLRSGFTATALYTWSHSIDDDAALGGQGALAGGVTTQSSGNSQPAQNWRDLHAERSRSTFDQRHLLTTSLQYTTGMGLSGGTLLGGWRGRVFKEWTAVAEINAGSGLPENPTFLATVPGTGEIGILRPNRTGAALYGGATGHYLNVAAFSAPAAGQFGNAGRNSITGPGTFTCNASLARTFRLTHTYNLDIHVDAKNVLNHAVFTAYNTTISPTGTNPTFGLPVSTNAMRSLQTTARLRF